MGWYDSSSGGVQYYTSSGVSARNYDKTTSTTLYAHWEKNVEISATCTGEYEDGYGLAKLNVNVTKGNVTNYKFMLDGKVVQNGTSSSYKQ